MTIEEMKNKFVADTTDYIKDLVIRDKHDALFNFIYLHCFNNFKDMNDEEIKQEYKSIYEEDA
tara:strand:+ start:776 stop:964 length:189 start_codon:yes stop_codon:yes gene_type:complete